MLDYKQMGMARAIRYELFPKIKLKYRRLDLLGITSARMAENYVASIIADLDRYDSIIQLPSGKFLKRRVIHSQLRVDRCTNRTRTNAVYPDVPVSEFHGQCFSQG